MQIIARDLVSPVGRDDVMRWSAGTTSVQSGTYWPQRCEDNYDLYPCSESWKPRRSKSDRLPLNDDRLGVLYGNHIKPLIRRGIALSRVQRIIYGFRTKGCYTDTQRSLESYMETIYT